MKYNKNLFNLKKIKHLRRQDVILSAEQHVESINKFVSQDKFQKYLSLFDEKIGIPNDVLSQYIKSIIAGRINYYNNSNAFPRTKLISMLKEIPKFFLFIFLIFIKRKKKINSLNQVKYDLMIDKVYDNNDLLRFERLISLYNEQNVVVIKHSNNNIQFKNVKVSTNTPLKNYDIKVIDLYKIFTIFLHSIKYSFIISENLISYTLSILNTYYFYRSIFSETVATNCIIFQHYHTDAIKNYLFKTYGGLNSCAIQKNIPKLGRSSFYYDADIFFSYSLIFSNQFLKCGSRFKKNIPVGSLFYNNYLNNKKYNILKTKYDIVLIGGNGFFKNGPEDIYHNQMSDYIRHLIWYKELSLEYKNLSFAFCPHQNFTLENSIEFKYLKEGKINFTYENVYSLCLNSKINLAWCSSVIVEIKKDNVNSYFLDPHKKNRQFLDDSPIWNDYRISNYEELRLLVKKVAINKKNVDIGTNLVNHTIESSQVSELIYRTLNKK